MCRLLATLLLVQLTIFPSLAQPTRLHFAIAAPPSSPTYGRAFQRTLANVTVGLSPNLTLDTVAVDLPQNGSFSAQLLQTVCDQLQGKRMAAVLIVGSSPAAFTVSMAAKHAGVPVLWARGSSPFLPGFRSVESSSLEVHLAPDGPELVHALRSLLLQAHWHTFTLLADRASATALRRPELWRALGATPLHPTLVGLPSPLRPQTLFRKLADISRSTRGVIVLMSDRPSSVRILEEARRLNMLDGHFVWLWVNTAADHDASADSKEPQLPAGLLSLRPLPVRVDRHLVKGAVRILATALRRSLGRVPQDLVEVGSDGCWGNGSREDGFVSGFARELKVACTNALAGKKFSQEIAVDKVDKSLVANFEILNLVPERYNYNNKTETEIPSPSATGVKWRRVGLVSGRSVRLDTIVWPGGDLSVAAVSSRARSVFRVATALAPPFVMSSELDEDGQCLRGLTCHGVLTSDKDNLTLVFNELQRIEEKEDEEENEGKEGEAHKNQRLYEDHKRFFGDYQREEEEEEDDERFFPFQKFKYRTYCCYGLAMDLLDNVAQELEFDFRLYIVADGLFGSRIRRGHWERSERAVKKRLSYRFKDARLMKMGPPKDPNPDDDEVEWNGIMGDLISGAAHMSFAALSVSSARSQVIDFSVPYFFSGVSFLAAPQQKSEIPLMAFLLPFSMELWVAIFTSLNITAVAVAIYEWLSPFGLNPWGRQRSKNFSMSSALWVMWGLLCGHLVAFKAPKSWPNKFLINVWGGFSVIFVASYTANIAALIAGLFFHNTVSDYHDRSLLSQKVGAPRSSAAEYYVQKANQVLWEHIRKYAVSNIDEGVERLRNGTLDILIADTPILDYYRATDHGCKLQKIGDDAINEDTYAIGMGKGFPLKDSISAVIAKYSSNGYMDILQEKWYGGLPCFKLASDIAQPRPLGVAAVMGVFILLGVGIALGLLILLFEHLFFRYTLPMLRNKPKGSIWHSRNIMFFSQKLYRFINCVELVSPHHAARELVHTIRQGQITSLFQKSIKRKEHEQRRRRKSKAQFFEMIQEIRRQQQEEREPPLEPVTEVDSEYQLSPNGKRLKLSPSIIRRKFLRSSPKAEKARSPYFNKQLFSPRSKNKTKSSTSLNVRRFSTDSVFSCQASKPDPSAVIGRRLSKDASAFLSSSPPDMNSRRSSYMDMISSGSRMGGKSPILSIENLSDCSKYSEPMRKLSDSESIGKKLATLPRYQEPVDKHRLQPQYSLTLGKSDETLSKSDREASVPSARSFNNLSDDEIAKRNKQILSQLRNPKVHKRNNRSSPNPQIRIQVEDTTQSEARHPLLSKTRHQSLGDETEDPPEVKTKRSRLPEQSKSLDAPASRERSRSRSGLGEGNLPPAPPAPNCSPRNSSGRSPLEKLSKEELMMLWRSSESELRSHLLKALRNKEEPDPP